jgi:hypothetical protein
MIFRDLSRSRVRMLSLFLLMILFLNIGCSKKGEHTTAKVHGKVTFNGQPMKFGSLLFVPEGNFPSAQGIIQSNGTYSMGTYDTADGAVIGKHKVMITAHSINANVLPEDAVKGSDGSVVSVIPERYGDLEKSGLTADVSEDDNTVNFDLVSTETKPAK